jgi:uncharacterized protein involved in type VI secretion and phage assembly
MTEQAPFAVPMPWPFGVQLGVVVNVADPLGLSRVQVTLRAPDPAQAAPVWARVAVPVAGPHKGTFLIPDVGDEVLVAFIAGDSRAPVVVGSMWNGQQTPPETLSANGSNGVDRWTFTGRNGTRLAIVEESSGQETISLTTSGGVSGTLTATAGGKVEFKTSNATVTLDTSGVSVRTFGTIKVKASEVDVQAAQMKVQAALVKFDTILVDCSGVVKCAVLQASAVVSSAYTPGAGNIW